MGEVTGTMVGETTGEMTGEMMGEKMDCASREGMREERNNYIST